MDKLVLVGTPFWLGPCIIFLAAQHLPSINLRQIFATEPKITIVAVFLGMLYDEHLDYCRLSVAANIARAACIAGAQRQS